MNHSPLVFFTQVEEMLNICTQQTKKAGAESSGKHGRARFMLTGYNASGGATAGSTSGGAAKGATAGDCRVALKMHSLEVFK